MPDPYVLPRRFAGMRKKISLFLLTAVLGVTGAVLLVAYKQGAFVRHTSIYFYTDDAFGISKGQSVRLFGLPVGSVKDLEISDRGVKVQLSINSEYTPRVPRTTKARLTREGYIGAANIQMLPGADPAASPEPVTEGDVIGFIPSRGVTELVEEIKTQLTPMVNEMRRMFADLNAPNSDFRKSVEGASLVFQQLPETNRELRQVLRNADQTLLSVGQGAESTFSSAARVSAQLEEQLPVVSAKLGTALDSLAEAATEIRATARKNGDALHEALSQAPALIRGGGELVRDGQEVMGAAKSTWLIRDYIEAPAMRTLPVDSFESFRMGSEVPGTSAQR
jgi:phospholipid/cholesterol/gamma-HCH transport system substrate-binding protein